MCEYRLYQPFHVYIDSIVTSTLTSSIKSLNYTNYTFSIISDTVSDNILSHANTLPPNTIAVYIGGSPTHIDEQLLFELNKWFLYQKCRGTCSGTFWACKMGILREIVSQVGMQKRELCSQIYDVCGEKFHKIFNYTDYIDGPMCDEWIPASTPCKPLDEVVHVLLATYERNKNLHPVINMLKTQSSKNIHLHLLDNNTDPIIQKGVDTILGELDATIPITMHRPGENTHCFGRITYIRKLMSEYLMEYIVVFDDDQIFEAKWIENMVRDRKPLSILSWYGKLFNTCDYWKSTLTYWSIQHRTQPEVKEFTYFGPGGCIMDTNLFLFNELYDYKKYSEDILAIDDIWLSFTLKKYMNIPFHRNLLHPLTCIDWRDNTKMTWVGIKDKKKDLMSHLSNTYEWDVTKPAPTAFNVNSVFERVYLLYTSNDNSSVETLHKMNICATCIPIDIDIKTSTKKIFECALQKGIKTVLILHNDIEFDEFFHYKFDKYMRNISREWGSISFDNMFNHPSIPIIGYNYQSMLEYISEMK